MNFFFRPKFLILGENGRVSRFNSGDLAGKCAASNRQQKIALRAENSPCPFSLYRLLRFNGLFGPTKQKSDKSV